MTEPSVPEVTESDPSPFDPEQYEDEDDSFFDQTETQDSSVDADTLLLNAMVAKEKALFMQLPVLEHKKDPIECWKDWSTKGMPLLSAVARKWLAVPASSASSERVFSSAGLTISKKRTKLGAERAATLVFLKTAWPALEAHGVLFNGNGPTAALTQALRAAAEASNSDSESE